MKEFRAKVIGKWIKGKIWKRPMLSLYFTENYLHPEYYDLHVKMAFWNAVEKGDYIKVPMKQDQQDKLWYPHKKGI